MDKLDLLRAGDDSRLNLLEKSVDLEKDREELRRDFTDLKYNLDYQATVRKATSGYRHYSN